jgi:hypothetical protein
MEGRRAWIIALTGLLFVLAGCDPSHGLAVRNRMTEAWYVRVSEIDRDGVLIDVSVFVVPATVYEWAFPDEIGPMRGTIELLARDCSVEQKFPAQGGSIVEISVEGKASARYYEDEDAPFPTRLLAETTRCGGLEQRPSGTLTPEPSGSSPTQARPSPSFTAS